MRSIWSVVGLAALAASGCGEKAIELSFQEPAAAVASQYDVSCVRAVRVDLDGANYPEDGDDYAQDCIDIEAGSTSYASVRDKLVGQIDVALPASGLSGVEVYGHAGQCDSARPQDFDLVFYASAPYVGQDTLVLPLIPNVSCEPADAVVRPVDVLKLIATKQCAMATWTEGKLGLTSVVPMPFTGESYWWGGQASAPIVNGVAAIRGNTKVSQRACLAIGLYTDDWNLVTCVGAADQRVCATGAEIEAPMISLAVHAATEDLAKTTQWGSLLVGAVYGTQPIAGATVTLEDTDKGEIVYFDLPPGVEAGTGALTVRRGTSTGPSGLFGIYTESIVNITVTSNGKTVKRLVAGNTDTASTVIVKL
jgi:hypothetical protein